MKSAPMEGRKFGMMTVLAELPRNMPQRTHYRCRCECGTEKTMAGTELRRKKGYKSCGCRVGQSVACSNIDRAKHGLSSTRGYRAWKAMKQRCIDPKTVSYPRYGGRGIRVCERWMTVENFIEDMGQPGPDESIDRIDVNGNYEPSNCRWATIIEQARNKTINVQITFNGKTQCLAAWAEETGINSCTIQYRMKAGWTIEKALTVHPSHTESTHNEAQPQ